MSPRPTNSIGKEQPIAEDLQQHVDVFGRGDAAEQHDVALRANLVGQRPGAREQRLAVLRIVGRDVDGRESRSASTVTPSPPRGDPAFGVITSAPLAVSGRSGSGGRANSSA